VFHHRDRRSPNPSPQPTAWRVIGTQIRTAMFSAFKRTIVRDLSALTTAANPGLASNIHLVRTRKFSLHPYSHTPAIVRGYPAPIGHSNSFVLPLAAHILQVIPTVRSNSTSKSSPVSPPRTSSGRSSLTYLMEVWRASSQRGRGPPLLPTKSSPKRNVISMRSSGP